MSPVFGTYTIELIHTVYFTKCIYFTFKIYTMGVHVYLIKNIVSNNE